ncbi:gcn5-related n-acetyltransferase [Leptolyngbya sp. Heron Island J]|uniref:GNAT family N-acetyltransferase n=1 Tax=Leptolyngbya sp. Heron Island J TaxID=1385935 RepID=UPI0003B9580C|nr:GNAT family N-acetyltransferase [Leptolyngbya sp. Heron Island J]ESA34103.1 gcn5-related n-acetyltransferase [Leptolyngbya sp. Heron Island J]
MPISQQTFLKVPFVWEESEALIKVSSQLAFEPVKSIDDQLIEIVRRVMAESVDASDRRRSSEHDPRKATETFLNSAREDFAYQDEWWQFGINGKGEIVGFVLPVIFPGCTKEGLEEGTIYYMGVLPKYRGLGLANELLSKGTQILQEVGVWRVFCDTAMDNARMIAAFKRVGYRQYGEPLERPV